MGPLKLLAASLAALGCVAGTAAAQSPPPDGLEIRLTASATEAKLGDLVLVTATLANVSDKVISIINPELDFQSMSLRLRWREAAPKAPEDDKDGKDGVQEPPPTPPVPAPAPPTEEGDESKQPPAKPDPLGRRREVRIERFVPGFQVPKQMDTRQLPPGETMSAQIQVPMMYRGAITIEALYNGFGLAALLSAPLSGSPLVSDPLTVQVAGTEHNLIGVKLETTHGTVEVELWPHLAPNHVFNFLSLSHSGFYDDSFIPRIKTGFVVQGGSPENNATGTPGWSIPPEFNEVKHVRGILSMARGRHPYTAGSQFFICLADCPQLDPETNRGMGYTAFGKLLGSDAGLKLLEGVAVIRGAGGEISKPTTEVKITKATPFTR